MEPHRLAAAGNGALSDLDALREDRVGQQLLGLRHVPSGRRLGKYLARSDEVQLGTLLEVARSLARQLAPAVVEHEAAVRGYAPVFIDGTAIELDGTLFEGARRGYDGTHQYRPYGVFIGSLWAIGRLNPGGCDVAEGWRKETRKRCGAVPARGHASVAARAQRLLSRRAHRVLPGAGLRLLG